MPKAAGFRSPAAKSTRWPSASKSGKDPSPDSSPSTSTWTSNRAHRVGGSVDATDAGTLVECDGTFNIGINVREPTHRLCVVQVLRLDSTRGAEAARMGHRSRQLITAPREAV